MPVCHSTPGSVSRRRRRRVRCLLTFLSSLLLPFLACEISCFNLRLFCSLTFACFLYSISYFFLTFLHVACFLVFLAFSLLLLSSFVTWLHDVPFMVILLQVGDSPMERLQPSFERGTKSWLMMDVQLKEDRGIEEGEKTVWSENFLCNLNARWALLLWGRIGSL